MAQDFAMKEARLLIGRHKELLSDLDRIQTIESALKTNIEETAKSLVAKGTLKKAILNACKQESAIQVQKEAAQNLVCHLYRYRIARPSIEAANQYRDAYGTEVKQNIASLNPGLAGLSWLFKGKQGKEKIACAYEALSLLLREPYGQHIPTLLQNAEGAAHLSSARAWEEYCEDPTSFLADLETVLPKATHKNEADNPFRPVLVQLATLEQMVETCKENTDKEQEKVKAAVNRLRAQNALQVLRAVPVEELNHDKAGFRVKALREAGITTMADIYAMSVYQLSSVHGVSDSGALSMKRIAQGFLTEATEETKIKLSVDEKNKYSTELIKAICLFRQKEPVRKDVFGLVDLHKKTLRKGKETLEKVGNGLAWLFCSPIQRENIREAYAEISRLIGGEYAKTLAFLSVQLLHDSESVSAEFAWADFEKHSIDYFSILEEIVPGALGNDDSLYGLPEDLAREIQEEVLFPDGLLCTLRRYQEWGVKYILHQKKALLGDEMGLGKTVQAIATMVSLRNTGATHFMVICPASVITNWCREIPKHSLLRVTKIHGAGRSRALRSWVKTGGVAVTTFETTAYLKDDDLIPFFLAVVDEAHYVKNPEARRSINVKRICEKAERLLFMTGTALENKVDEMISLIEILQPQVAASVQGLTFMPNAPQFRNRVAPVYYRRKREDVLTELPELIEVKEWCTLNPEEKEQYESNVLSGNYAALRRLSWEAKDLAKSCKANRLLEIIEEATAENRKILIFSFFLDTMRAIGNLLGSKCYGPINGSVPPPRRQEIIDEFDKAPAGSVLLAQIQSGGTGLNIQSASVVVICEPQFKPSTENQAISRAYRMGQARNVLVYRLLCTNTIDEKITQLLEHKQELFDAFADKSVAAGQSETYDAEVDEKKFGQLIKEEIDRINAEKGFPSEAPKTQ